MDKGEQTFISLKLILILVLWTELVWASSLSELYLYRPSLLAAYISSGAKKKRKENMSAVSADTFDLYLISLNRLKRL